VSFNIILDEVKMGPEKYQKLTYMLTHMYYDWPGTVRVPAPVQYAHKLAFLTAEILQRCPNDALSDKLFL
jgi:aubergine-like protein